MFLELIIAIILGCLVGIISGLTPGIHVNLVSVILVSVSPVLLVYTSPIVLAVFIISLGITHTFLDAIPSIFLGAPDPDMVLSVLPGHRMLLEGKGYEAVKLTAVGSFFCLLITLALIPISIPFLPWLQDAITPVMAYLIIFVVLWMIMLEKGIRKKFFSLYIIIQTGILGFIVFNMPNLSQPLLPMLSGLFGTSSLILSLGEKTNMPKQEITDSVKIGKGKTIRSFLAGVFSGTITAILPGVGAAQASIIGAMLAGKKIGNHAFLMLVGGISTVNFAFSIATWFAIEKARNGAIVALMEIQKTITYREMLILIFASLVAGCIALYLALQFAKIFSKLMNHVNYKMLAIGIIIFVSILVISLTGWQGGLVLLVSTFMGIMPPLLGVKRSHNMGCLLLPVIVYFLM